MGNNKVNSLSNTARLPGTRNQVTAQTLAGDSVICTYVLPKYFIKNWDIYSSSTAFVHLQVNYVCLRRSLLFVTSCGLWSYMTIIFIFKEMALAQSR